MTQWVFTTVSLANLLWFFLLGSGPVGCLLCCLSNGKTQIWLGDLRLALFLVFCVLVVFLVVICQASCDHRRPCSSFLTNSFVSCKDRALERDRPDRRKKKTCPIEKIHHPLGEQHLLAQQLCHHRVYCCGSGGCLCWSRI